MSKVDLAAEWDRRFKEDFPNGLMLLVDEDPEGDENDGPAPKNDVIPYAGINVLDMLTPFSPHVQFLDNSINGHSFEVAIDTYALLRETPCGKIVRVTYVGGGSNRLSGCVAPNLAQRMREGVRFK